MNELERDQLQILLNNELLLRTIKKLFILEIEKNIPKVNDIDNNGVLGQKYRAYIESKDLFDKCFIELESYKAEKKLKDNFNKAR